MKRQKAEEIKIVEINRIEEWKVEKILNKRKIRGVVKYLVWWKRFTTENDIWEKEKNSENAKKAVAESEKRLSAEVRQ